MKNKAGNTCLILIILLGTINAITQTPLLKSYTIDDGLPSNFVYQAAQDHDGYMWFCTDKGVVKFDGTDFKTFTTSHGLKYNDSWNIEVDQSNNVWIDSYDDLRYIKNNMVYKFPLPREYQTTQFDLHVFNKNEHFVVGRHKTLSLQILHDTIITLKQDPASFLIFKNDSLSIFRTKLGSKDEIVFTYYDKNHTKVYKKTLAFKENLAPKIIYLENKIYCLWSKNIITLDTKGVISIINTDEHFNQNIIPFKSGILGDKIFLNGSKTNIIVDNKLRIIDTPEYLQSQNINSVFLDQDLNTWVCTNSGIKYFLSEKTNVRNITTPKTFSNLTGIAISENKQIFIISLNGEIYKLNKDFQLESFFSTNLNNLENIYFNNNKVYISDQNKGLFKTDFKSIKSVENKYIKSTYIDKNNIIISHSRGVLFSANEYKIEIDKQRSYASTFSDDYLWYGTLKHLYEIERKNLNKEKPRIILEAFIKNLTLDEDENLWIATENKGIWYYNDTLHYIENSSKINANKLLVISADEIYVASSNGLFSITDKKEIKHFNKNIGIIPTNIIDIANKDSSLYLLGHNVLSIVNRRNLESPRRFYQNFKIDEIYINQNSSILKNEYKLKANEQNIFVQYSAISYPNIDEIKYAWRLIGFDDNWYYSKNKSQLFNLTKAGNYTLEIKAVDASDNIIGEIQSIELNLQHRWYNKWWMKLIYILLLFLSILTIVQIWTRRINNKARVKRELVEYQLKAIQAQMNPHFIFNALNSIQNYIYDLEPDQASVYLSKFSKLMRLILESTKRKFISLEEEIELLENYCQLERMRFDNSFDYQITFDNHMGADEILIPSTFIQPFVENAINHGLAQIDRKGELEIIFKFQNEILECQIIDNGIGINNSKKMKTGTHVSRAMEILTERSEILNKNAYYRIGFNIIDREITNQKGTIATINIQILNNEIESKY